MGDFFAAGSAAGVSPGFGTTGIITWIGTLGVCTSVKYAPARQAPLTAPTASTSQLDLQLVVLRDSTKATPRPNPFCGGMLPAAMCSGWSVKSSMPHAGTALKLALQASAIRWLSRRKSACSQFSCARVGGADANIADSASVIATLDRILPPVVTFPGGGSV